MMATDSFDQLQLSSLIQRNDKLHRETSESLGLMEEYSMVIKMCTNNDLNFICRITCIPALPANLVGIWAKLYRSLNIVMLSELTA